MQHESLRRVKVSKHCKFIAYKPSERSSKQNELSRTIRQRKRKSALLRLFFLRDNPPRVLSYRKTIALRCVLLISVRVRDFSSPRPTVCLLALHSVFDFDPCASSSVLSNSYFRNFSTERLPLILFVLIVSLTRLCSRDFHTTEVHEQK